MEIDRPDWIKTGTEAPSVVSYRRYDNIWPGYMFPGDYLTPEMQILCVGEGLSGFSKELSKKTGASVIAIDPIYELGKSILGKTPDQLRRALKGRYGEYVGLNQRSGDDIVIGPDPKKILAASIYGAPFVDGHLDIVLAHRLIEHIDFSLALPEMLRVLKPNGEIRLGGVLLSLLSSENDSVDERRLYSGVVGYNGSEGGYIFWEMFGFSRAMKWLSKQEKFNAFVASSVTPSRSEVRDLGGTVAGTMIIRKDEVQPDIYGGALLRIEPGAVREGRFGGKTYKVGKV